MGPRQITMMPRFNDYASSMHGPVASILGILFCSSTALGQQVNLPPVTLEWTAPAGCPSQAEMLEQITRMIGTIPGSAEPLKARIVVAESFEGFQGNVELSASGQASQRSVSSGSCRGVSDALAVIVALAVEPGLAQKSAIAAAVTSRPAVPSRNAVPRQNSGLELVAGASALLEAGRLPSATFGAELSAGLGARPLHFEALGGLLASRRATLASRPLDGADLSLARLGARGCYEVARSIVGIGPCIGGGAEWIHAQGIGANERWPADGRLGVVSIGVRMAADPVAGFRLHLYAEQVTALNRLTFVIDNAGTVFVTPRSSFRAALGTEFHF